MPSDAVWVALIGSGATVASLTVQGLLTREAEKRRNEREDKQRQEDRAQRVREQNDAERREFYNKLLAAADRAEQGVMMFSDSRNRGFDRDVFNAAHSRAEMYVLDYSEIRSQGDLIPYDPEVLDIARAFGTAASAAIAEIYFESDPGNAGVEDVILRTETPAIDDEDKLGSVVALHKQLRSAARRDIGYENPLPT